MKIVDIITETSDAISSKDLFMGEVLAATRRLVKMGATILGALGDVRSVVHFNENNSLHDRYLTVDFEWTITYADGDPKLGDPKLDRGPSFDEVSVVWDALNSVWPEAQQKASVQLCRENTVISRGKMSVLNYTGSMTKVGCTTSLVADLPPGVSITEDELENAYAAR